ncbi:MAG: 5-(carboxyamino)imidazole ribonucleotide synthase, partial [Acinetobacter sp.]
GRKLGHITLMPNKSDELIVLCRQLAQILPVPLALTADMNL